MSREHVAWGLLALALTAVLLWPLVGAHDGFPLSNYPMFSVDHGRVVKLPHVVGRTADGEVRPLPPRLLGTFEVMQAAQTARIAAKRTEHAVRLCERVAAALRDEPELAAAFTTVEVRTDRYDIIAYWQSHAPEGGTLHASCPVVPDGAGAQGSK